MKVPFGLSQAPAYFQELMTGILKDFPFAIAYLDDIIIFSKTPQEHLSHIRMVFKKLKLANLSMKKSKCNETFSHTPDEARSVGLAKACVLQKIYSVLEKISYNSVKKFSI